MKENGMDKLINFVYQYNNEKEGLKLGLVSCVKEGDIEVEFDKEKEIRRYEEHIISKKYGFIQWLLKKNKIDFDKVMKLGIPCFVQYDNGEIISVHDVDFDRQLIMLLSISDTPIEDLISYLK